MKTFSFGRTLSLHAIVAAVVLSAAAAPAIAIAAQAVSFNDKTITVLVGSHTGGSSDLSARLMAPFVAKYLPGSPSSVVQNMPGAHSLIAMNFFVTQAPRDGTTAVVGSSSQTDPINYRVPQSHYDPTTFAMVGGVNIGGTSMIIRNDALPRLTENNAKPVTMGTVSGYPHVGMLMTAWGIEYLGWHARWISGYGNNSDLTVALERREIDMTSLANAWFLRAPRLMDKEEFTIIYQTGLKGGTAPSAIPALAKTPLFTKVMKGKISSRVAKEAYEYWRNLSYVFKWMALPPKTPKAVVAAYRGAFAKAIADPEFVALGQKITPGFSEISAADLTTTVHNLAAVSPEAIHYMTKLLNKQGLKVVATKRKKKHKHKQH